MSKTPEELAYDYGEKFDGVEISKNDINIAWYEGYKAAEEHAHAALEEAEARIQELQDQLADTSKVMPDHNADASKKVDEVSALLDENELVDMKLKRQYDKAYLDLVLSTPGCNPLTSFGVPPHKHDVNIIGEYVEHLEDVIAARSCSGILNNWISVKDRLPEDGKAVLGIVYNDIRLGWIKLITTDPGQFHWVGSGIYIDKGHYALTYWQELPEPPKEEQQ